MVNLVDDKNVSAGRVTVRTDYYQAMRHNNNFCITISMCYFILVVKVVTIHDK